MGIRHRINQQHQQQNDQCLKVAQQQPQQQQQVLKKGIAPLQARNDGQQKGEQLLGHNVANTGNNKVATQIGDFNNNNNGGGVNVKVFSSQPPSPTTVSSTAVGAASNGGGLRRVVRGGSLRHPVRYPIPLSTTAAVNHWQNGGGISVPIAVANSGAPISASNIVVNNNQKIGCQSKVPPMSTTVIEVNSRQQQQSTANENRLLNGVGGKTNVELQNFL